MAATLGSGAVSGMKIVAFAPSSRAASATPCAWLPALAATTPRARSSSVSREIRVYAPRILNDPVRWRFSHLSHTGPPTRSARPREWCSGVCRTTSCEQRGGGLDLGTADEGDLGTDTAAIIAGGRDGDHCATAVDGAIAASSGRTPRRLPVVPLAR